MNSATFLPSALKVPHLPVTQVQFTASELNRLSVASSASVLKIPPRRSRERKRFPSTLLSLTLSLVPVVRERQPADWQTTSTDHDHAARHLHLETGEVGPVLKMTGAAFPFVECMGILLGCACLKKGSAHERNATMGMMDFNTARMTSPAPSVDERLSEA